MWEIQQILHFLSSLLLAKHRRAWNWFNFSNCEHYSYIIQTPPQTKADGARRVYECVCVLLNVQYMRKTTTLRRCVYWNQTYSIPICKAYRHKPCAYTTWEMRVQRHFKITVIQYIACVRVRVSTCPMCTCAIAHTPPKELYTRTCPLASVYLQSIYSCRMYLHANNKNYANV